MIILGLGSNIEDRLENLRKTIYEIKKKIHGIKLSPIYESSAVLMPDSPKEWNKKYLNMALIGSSELTPQQMLEYIKNTELSLGRTPSENRWAPRKIDIDILCIDNIVMNSDELTIPHKELLNRPFALWPLTDLFSSWIHPTLNLTSYELSQRFGVIYPEAVYDNNIGTIRTDLEIND